MSKKREELLEQIWAAQDTAYDLMSEYDSLPHSYGENVLYQAEAHLIDRIALHPGVTVTDLANMVRKTPSACSQLVRRLRDKGWVEQVRNTANNRQVMLRLTPAGEHVYRDHAAFDKQCQALTFRAPGGVHRGGARHLPLHPAAHQRGLCGRRAAQPRILHLKAHSGASSGCAKTRAAFVKKDEPYKKEALPLARGPVRCYYEAA